MDSNTAKTLESLELAQDYEIMGKNQAAGQIYVDLLTSTLSEINPFITASQRDYRQPNLKQSAKNYLLKAQQKLVHIFQLYGSILDLDLPYASIQVVLQTLMDVVSTAEIIWGFDKFFEDFPSSEIFFEPLPLPVTDLSSLLFRAQALHAENLNPQAALACLDAIHRLDLSKKN